MKKFNTIYNEDCLVTMAGMKDKEVDLVFTSPPYNMNLRIRNGKYCSRQITKEFSTKYEGFNDNVPIDEFYESHSEILRELIRVSKTVFYNIQIVTGSKRAFFKMIGEFSDNLKDIIIWDKTHGQPAMGEGVLNRRSELILVFEEPEEAISRKFNRCTFDRGTLEDVWEIKRGKKIAKNHGATFPELLAETVISNFSNPGDLIYDPFTGSGTTSAVAKRLGRNYIGSELLKTYHEFAEERVKNTP